MDKDIVYLDYAAATPLDSSVKKVMEAFLSENYGNPSSFHQKGIEARTALDSARETVAKTLGVNDSSLIFTGSGTESVNLAIKGVALAKGNEKKHIITTKIEHKAVLNTCKYLEDVHGFSVTYLSVDENGFISLEELENAIGSETCLVSVIYAHNEIGVIQDVNAIGDICKKNKVLFHSDACQAGNYLSLKDLNVDLLSLNGSKIYGPKGVGLLVCSDAVTLSPLIHGGGQEQSYRSGTENVSGIIGFSEALKIVQNDYAKESERLNQLRKDFVEKVLKEIEGSVLYGPSEDRLANNINLGFKDVDSAALLLALDEKGFCVSSGSACSAHSNEVSYVILALTGSEDRASESIRISLGRWTSAKDLDGLFDALVDCIKNLRS